MAFAATKRKRIGVRQRPVEQLRLTSMIDMFTILLVYLLKSYSPTDMPPVDPNLKLPSSISTKNPIETTIIQAAQNMIIVDGIPLLAINREDNYSILTLKLDGRGHPMQNSEGAFMVDKKIAEDQAVLSPLLDDLKQKVKEYQKLAGRVGKEFEGKVTIMCDKDMPYQVLRKVMATAGKAGFGEFKFATLRNEE